MYTQKSPMYTQKSPIYTQKSKAFFICHILDSLSIVARENRRLLLQSALCVAELFRLLGWLQLVGSIKLLVSCAKEPYKRDNILQKRPIILSILLTVATPYK